MAVAEMNSIVAQKVEVAPGLSIIRIIPEGWELPIFKPGQYTVVALRGSAPRFIYSDPEPNMVDPRRLIKRAYSIASSSKEKEYIEIYVRLVNSGALTPRLFALNIGDKLWLSPKAKGMFTMEDVPKDKNIILFATGTGVAPYMSMLRSHVISKEKRNYAVIHSAWNSWDLGYRSELMTIGRLCPNFHYIPVVSSPENEPVPWQGKTGFVQHIWKDRVLQDSWGTEITAKNTRIFLCGHPDMIKEMVELLTDDSFKEHTNLDPGTIHLEKFW